MEDLAGEYIFHPGGELRVEQRGPFGLKKMQHATPALAGGLVGRRRLGRRDSGMQQQHAGHRQAQADAAGVDHKPAARQAAGAHVLDQTVRVRLVRLKMAHAALLLCSPGCVAMA